MRQLLIVRHAIAETRATDDAARALTVRGRARMKKAAAGIARIVPAIDAVYSSPLLRASQTAQILCEAFGELTVCEEAMLAPGSDPATVAGWIDRLPHAGTVAVVGHEPDCSLLLSWLIAGTALDTLRFRKGGACLAELPDGAAAGKAGLAWFATPRILRRAGA